MSFKCVIFDFDGTIINSETLHRDATYNIMRRYGLRPEDVDHNSFIGGSTDAEYAVILQLAGSRDNPADLSWEHFYEVLRLALEAYPEPSRDFLDTIDWLDSQGIQYGICTSSRMPYVGGMLNKWGIYNRFSFLTTWEDCNEVKPDPGLYLKSIEKSGFAPEDCVVIEDSRNGTLSAHAAGLKCIGIINPDSGDQIFAYPLFEIHKLSEIIDKI